MKNVKPTPRHRKARRPLAPVADIAGAITSSVSPHVTRTTAVASATGLALSAVVTMTASAAPVTDDAASTAVASTVNAAPTTVSTADIAWSVDALDDVTATAEAAPAPVVAPVAHTTRGAATTAAASRTETRATVVDVPASTTSAVVAIALQYLGTPYVYGGASPAGFDCSGFTQYVYARLGVSLPHSAVAQGYAGTFVPASEAQPGDLVWHSYGHVGIYIGNGKVIEATKPGDVVKINSLWGSYQFVRL